MPVRVEGSINERGFAIEGEINERTRRPGDEPIAPQNIEEPTQNMGAPRNSLPPVGGDNPLAALRRPKSAAYDETQRRYQEADDARTSKLTSIANKLGADFDAGGMLDDPGLRFDLGRSDKLSERRAKFFAKYRDEYPQAEYRSFDGVDVYRLSKDEPYRPVASLRDTKWPDVAQGTGTVANAETAGMVAGGIGAGLLMPPAASPALSLALGSARILGTGAGSYAGARLDRVIEQTRGYEHTPFDEFQKRSLENALLAAGTEGGIRVFSAVRNMGGNFPLQDSAGRLLEAQQDIGATPLTVGQVARSPVVRGAYEQASGTSARIQEKSQEQAQSVFNSLRTRIDAMDIDRMNDTALDAISRKNDSALDTLIRARPVDRSQLGQMIQDAVTQWETNARAVRDKRYDKVASMSKSGNIRFDLENVQGIAGDLERGYLARGRLVPQLDEEGRPLLDKQGQPMMERIAPVQVEAATQRIGKLIKVIQDLDPTVQTFTHEGHTYNSLTQMVKLRDELYDLMSSPNGTERRQAAMLWGGLREAMEDPYTANIKYRHAYQKAKDAHIDFEEKRSLNYVRAALNKSDPGDLTESYFKPGHFSTMSNMREIAGPGVFDEMREYQKAKLLQNPENIPKMLDQFQNDPRTLELFFNKTDQSLLQTYYDVWQKSRLPQTQKLLADQQTLGQRAVDLATQGKAEELKRLVDLKPDMAKTMRAGIYQYILDSATEVSAEVGGRTINPQKLKGTIETLRKNEALNQFMDPADWRRLENYELYADVLTRSMDVGGQMQAGQVKAEIRSVTRPGRIIKGLHALGDNALTARVLSTPLTADMLTRATSGPNIAMPTLIGAATVALKNLEEER